MGKTMKIKVLSYAKLQAIIMAFAGFVAGILYAGVGAIYDFFTIGLNYGTALAFIALPIMPIYFAVFGFITGIIGASLYNLTTKWFRVIELDIKE